MTCAAPLPPPTDAETEDHERRMRVVARSMNVALLVTVAPVGLAAMTLSAVRGANLRVSSRIMTVTALFLGACQQGLSWQLGGLISRSSLSFKTCLFRHARKAIDQPAIVEILPQSPHNILVSPEGV